MTRKAIAAGHSGASVGYQAHPLRIQRKRTKGWQMPEGAVYVGRPSKWGNPMSVNLAVGRTLDHVLNFFRAYAENFIAQYRPNCDPQYRGLNIEELRGKQLACWCPLNKPCHADILAELANREPLPSQAAQQIIEGSGGDACAGSSPGGVCGVRCRGCLKGRGNAIVFQ